MATVNIIQPAAGSLQLVSPILSAYTVKFVPPTGEYTRGPIRLYCEACGQTLLESSDNPATFDISSLLGGGHPGPFDISISVAQEVWVEIRTYPNSIEAGTTTPASEIKTTYGGGSVGFSIKAIANEGWRFSNWTCLETGWTSTNYSTTYRVTNVTGYVYRTLCANFVKEELELELYATRGSSADGTVYTNKSYSDRLVYNDKSLHIATLRSCGYHYAGDRVTITCELTPEAIANGYKFVFWRIDVGYDSVTPSIVSTASCTFTMPARKCWCDAIISTDKTVRQFVRLENKLYGCFAEVSGQISEDYSKDVPGRLIVSEPAVYPDGVMNSSKRSAIEFLYPKGGVFSLYLYLYKDGYCPEQNMTTEARYAIIHGASMPQPWTADTDDQTLYIFMCNHLLKRNDSGSLLALNSGLIAGCNVRSGSPIYPVN